MFLKDHFDLLKSVDGIKKDKDHLDEYNKLKEPGVLTQQWGELLAKKISDEAETSFRNRPTNQGNIFKSYTWIKIYPSYNAPKELAYTVGIDAIAGFVTKIDTINQDGTELRKKYEKIRGEFDGESPIISTLSIEEGIHKTVEELAEWSYQSIKNFKYTYDEVCQMLDLGDGTNSSSNISSQNIKLFQHPLNQILYGPAGTGKTYNTINYALSILDGRNINDPQTENDRKIFKKYMDEGRISFVTFHQSYGYEDFVEGIRVDKNDQDQLTYDVKSGVFQKICDRAIGKEAVEQDIDVVLDEFAAEIHNKNLKLSTKTGTEFTVLSKSGKDITVRTSTTNELYISKAAIKAYILEPSENIRQNQAYAWSIAKHLQNSRNILKPVVDSKTQPYVLIIDEINRGNISKIFGELITLIEDSKRAGNKEQLTLTLPSSNKPFSVPKNLYIIGTMNSSDRSLTSVDIALRRRFEFIEMQPQPKVLKDIDIKELGKNAVSNILEVMNKRIKVLLDRDHCIGHAYFTPLIEDPSLENLIHIFEKRIIPLLQEYFFDDWTKINLVLGENGMVHTMNLDSTLFLSMNPSEIEHLKKRNWDVNNYLFQDAPLAIKVNALKQIISPKQDYKIPKPEITDEEAS
ncbi:McrB family protein [Acinetobacter indicus]|uniref:McrB family protein n=1 Tax=Acinetobacter indicus TaxID=756892 RepID=UPI001D171531|nr:AAA family ATPase [Acinetobacter indicus]